MNKINYNVHMEPVTFVRWVWYVDGDENDRDHHHHYHNDCDDIVGSGNGDEDSMDDGDDDGSQPPLPRLRQVLQPVSRAALLL